MLSLAYLEVSRSIFLKLRDKRLRGAEGECWFILVNMECLWDRHEFYIGSQLLSAKSKDYVDFALRLRGRLQSYKE